MKKKWLTNRRRKIIALVALSLGVVTALVWYFFPLGIVQTFITNGHQSFGSAPPAGGEPGCDPSQTVGLPNGMTLEVYDTWAHHFDGGNGLRAPVVLLRDRDGSRKWAVYSYAGEDSVYSGDIRFKSASGSRWLRTMSVSGERTSDPSVTTTWYITRSGALRDRWYISNVNFFGSPD